MDKGRRMGANFGGGKSGPVLIAMCVFSNKLFSSTTIEQKSYPFCPSVELS
jgi:hypothetical protein